MNCLLASPIHKCLLVLRNANFFSLWTRLSYKIICVYCIRKTKLNSSSLPKSMSQIKVNLCQTGSVTFSPLTRCTVYINKTDFCISAAAVFPSKWQLKWIFFQGSFLKKPPLSSLMLRLSFFSPYWQTFSFFSVCLSIAMFYCFFAGKTIFWVFLTLVQESLA